MDTALSLSESKSEALGYFLLTFKGSKQFRYIVWPKLDQYLEILNLDPSVNFD